MYQLKSKHASSLLRPKMSNTRHTSVEAKHVVHYSITAYVLATRTEKRQRSRAERFCNRCRCPLPWVGNFLCTCCGISRYFNFGGYILYGTAYTFTFLWKPSRCAISIFIVQETVIKHNQSHNSNIMTISWSIQGVLRSHRSSATLLHTWLLSIVYFKQPPPPSLYYLSFP
jgi:hypothetical protein